MYPFFGPLPTYSLMILIGSISGVTLATLRKRHDGISNISVLLSAIISLILGLIGAKLFYIIGTIPKVIRGELSPQSLFGSGFMFYGGLIVGILGTMLSAKLFNVPLKRLLDALAFGVPIGQAFGRLGCFFAGCCYGKPTNSVIGIIFTNPISSNTPIGIPLIPTQLIETTYCLLILGIMLLIFNKKRKDGSAFAFYCLAYAVCRFINEFFRGDLERGFVGSLSSSQFIALLFIIFFIIYYAISKHYELKRKNEMTFLSSKGIILKRRKCTKWNMMKFDIYKDLK